MLLSDKAYRVNPHKLTEAIKTKLEAEKISMPENGDLIKTGSGRQYNPQNSDWFVTRMASILRQAACKGTISLTGLSYRYGVRKNRGVRPTKFARGSQYVISKAIENLKELGLINFENSESIVTEKGVKMIEAILEELK